MNFQTLCQGRSLKTAWKVAIGLTVTGMMAVLPIGQPIAVASEMREMTIQAFQGYRKEKYLIESNQQMSYSEQITLRKNLLANTSRRGIAPELGKFFDDLQQEWQESAQLYAQMEREDRNLAQSFSMVPRSSDFLEDTLMQQLFTRPMSQAAESALVVRWTPQIYAIENRHVKKQIQLLSQLSKKYDYPFVDEVFGKVPPIDPNCRSKPLSQAVSVDGRSNQPVLGLSVCRGDYVSFYAGGFVSVGPYLGSTTPKGLSEGGAAYNRLRNAPHGSLLMKVGDENWRYGGLSDGFFAQSSGPIYFWVNDRATSNNKGGFVVNVTVDPVPAAR